MVGDKKEFPDIASEYLKNQDIDHEVKNNEIRAEEKDLHIQFEEDRMIINNDKEINKLKKIDEFI